jgi:ankyrin repeat protein
MLTVFNWLDINNSRQQHGVHEQYEKQLSWHLEGTCNWMFQKPEYLAWAAENNTNTVNASGILWICGPAGYGKTVLCAKIVERFQATHGFLVAYFFSSPHAASASEGDMNFIIRSWMMQIAKADSGVLNLLRDSSERSSFGNRALESEIWSAFETVLIQKNRIALFLDGLDEYPRTDNARINFLKRLKSVTAGTATKILITSREETDIKAELSPQSPQISAQFLRRCRITKEDVGEDLRLYSRSVVNNKLPKKEESLRVKLADQLAERSEGMFLWIHLQQPQLRDTKSRKNLERIVEKMPLGLSETYRKNWEAIKRQSPDDRDRAFAILRWTAFALRPLSISEISEALVVDAYSDCSSLPIDELTYDIDEEYIDNEIIAVCGSLVEVRRGSGDEQSRSKTIHFVHPSVRDFLLSVLPRHPAMLVEGASTVENTANPAQQHCYLSAICLAYLKFDNIWNDSESSQNCISEHPFLDYAARFWHLHLEGGADEDPRTSQMVGDLFRARSSTFSHWAEYFETCQRAEASDENLPGTPMYYAALFNLHTVMESIWNDDKTQLNILGGQYGTPLQAACVNHYQIPFHMLLRCGADVNAEGGQFGVALIAAAAGGFLDMVKVLTSSGANLELKDSMGRTALYTAVMNGFQDVVSFLLMAGSDIFTMNKYDWTLIHSAADSGHLEVVRMLLDQEADIPAANKDGWTPINSAASRGHLDVVRLLLHYGAEINIATKDGWVPINLAANRGHLDVVRLLLDQGADITAATKDGWNSLQLAALNGHLEMVRLLLDHGADVHTLHIHGWSALRVAAFNGHVEVVRLLLGEGADAGAADEEGWTPLHSAADRGHIEVVRLLLDQEVDFRTPDKNGWTPIHLVASHGHVEIVRLLLDQGASAIVPEKDGWTPLYSAAINGHSEVMRLLLDSGADIAVPDDEGTTPVNAAASNGHLETVQLLLDKGANVTIPNIAGETPLYSAALQGHIAVVQLLIDSREESVNLQGMGYDEALQGASLGGHEKIVEVLIEHGADVNARGKSHGTALQAACYKGHEKVVELLVAQGADVNVQDNLNAPSLHAAVLSNNMGIIRHLLAHNVNPAAHDFHGWTATMLAAYVGSHSVAHLIASGAPDTTPMLDTCLPPTSMISAMESSSINIADGGIFIDASK